MGLVEFFSNEAGQGRRKWLDRKARGLLDELQYYIGPGVDVDQTAEAFSMLNPVNDIYQSMQDAGRGDYVGSAINAATALAPVGLYKAAGSGAMDDVANVLSDTMAGVGMRAQGAANAGKQFAKSEFGGVGRGGKTGQQQAQEILDYLSAGRGSDVTDEMMAGADDMYLFNNYDLPMDVASRTARARNMGFDTGSPLYHGTTSKADFQELTPSQRGKIGPGVYTTPSQNKANVYAGVQNSLPIKFQPDPAPNARVMQLTAPNRPADMDARMAARGQRDNYSGDHLSAYREVFDERGFDGVSVEDERTILDPSKIRSKFARFDPRLKHLRNLSASLGGLGIFSLFAGDDPNGS